MALAFQLRKEEDHRETNLWCLFTVTTFHDFEFYLYMYILVRCYFVIMGCAQLLP